MDHDNRDSSDVAPATRAKIAAAIMPPPESVASLLESAWQACDWAVSRCRTQKDTAGEIEWTAERDALEAVTPVLVRAFDSHDALMETLTFAESWFKGHCAQAYTVDGGIIEHPMLTSIRAALKLARGST